MGHNCLRRDGNSWGPGRISMKKRGQNNGPYLSPRGQEQLGTRSQFYEEEGTE
jgi:hypothetical protein